MHFLLAAILLSWHAPNLTPAQRAWCERFARDAATLTVARLQQSATDARAASLPLVADYLERVGGDDAAATERALHASVHGQVVVISAATPTASSTSPSAFTIPTTTGWPRSRAVCRSSSGRFPATARRASTTTHPRRTCRAARTSTGKT